ncbi:MAG TPA: Dyp-type peroxidase [Chloroflexota bacterium]|nr:Dyp-type peroxidase [Chloroflexota bacterium]
MSNALDLADLQGIIARSYATLTAARYVLLAIDDPGPARSWLSALAELLTTARTRPETRAVNVAFTPSGLGKLGLGADVLAAFSHEFLDGLTAPNRGRLLGDVDANAPEHWHWGGPANLPIDILLLFFARDEAELAALETECLAAGANGLSVVARLETVDLGGTEHFGFADGISQPTIEGLSRKDAPANTVKAGEFILGYPNEYGLYTDRPTLPRSADPRGLLPPDPSGSAEVDLGRNGSYLVFRQLRQDVRAFWQFVDNATRRTDGTPDAAARVRLAAKMVGRWPSGAPLALAPDHDDPRRAKSNDFGYFGTDAAGDRCPLGAHVRRSNPRDSLDPDPGSEKSIAVGKRHRLLRRGREYGKPLPPEDRLNPLPPNQEDDERGLHFICLNANLARQFEFIQHTWVNNPTFQGLYADDDPLVGPRGTSGGMFTIQATPVRDKFTDLPRFVTVVGGAYFFLPGVRAVRYLASLGS